ncbi:MAG: aminotransferase class IV, partial [Candidatus Desulforudis sp.]|nr:aminotransferase class IV [Desulforudis sp.]
LNGELTELNDTVVSINDRAFLFGDGVYEAVRSYQGRLFGVDEHVARLVRSAAAIDLKLPADAAAFKELVGTVHRKSEISDALVYIQVSRGAEPRNHLFSLDLDPAVLITVRHLPDYLFSDHLEPLTAITVHDGRWDMCHIKSTSLLANILAKHKAREAGVDEAVFVRSDGVVTEAYASNVFMVRDGNVLTHPADNRVLGGITRRFVLDLCPRLGLKAFERRFTREDMLSADEVFVTNSVHEIRPVVQVDGRQISDGEPGRVTVRLLHAYRTLTVDPEGA